MHDPRCVFIIAQVHGDGDLPVAFAQDRLHLLQDVQIGVHVFQLPLFRQGAAQPFQIARGVVHVGFLNDNIEQFSRRVQDDIAHLGAFAHHLFVHLAGFGHVDHHVALNRRLTAQTAAIDHATLGFVAFFDAVPGAEGVGGHAHAVFGKFAVAGADLAFGADAAATADAVEVHAQLARSREDRGALGKAPAFARRGKDDEGISCHGPALLCVILNLCQCADKNGQRAARKTL